MYAVIKTGGKQYQVKVGDTVFVEKLEGENGATIKFDQVLAVSGDETVIGTPIVEVASVDATVVKNGKAKKVIVFKYKPKKGSKTKQGHRQPYTKVKIEKINA